MSLLGYVLLLTAALCCTAAPSYDASCTRPERMEEAELVGDWEIDSYPPGTTAIYQCRPGYILIGRIKKACIGGVWENFGRIGQCKKKSCGHPGDIPFGSFQLLREETFIFGAVVEYYCHKGYHMVSNEKFRQCTATGWSNYPPECEGSCTRPERMVEAELVGDWESDSYLARTEAIYQCRPGYNQIGTIKKTCIRGKWEYVGKKGECKKPCSPPPLLHGKYTPRKNEFTYEEYLQYECDTGYMTERRNLLATAQCLDGKWSEIPNCIAITCEHDSFLYKNKAVITYTCPHGKRPKSNLVQCFYYGWGPPVICQEEKPGQLDATNPSTDNIEKEEKRQKCPLPHNPKNAEIVAVKNAYYSNDEVTMNCTEGYRMYGSATIRCIHGKWEQPPECYEIGDQCGPPPPIKFGDTIEMKKIIYKPDEFVEYQCAIYHVFSGEKIVKCQNGVWGETPVCLEPCTAKERGMDENNIQLKVLGEKKMYLTHGDEIEFNCIFGYEALPNTQMRIACKHGKLEYPNCLRKGFCILQQQEMIANNIHYNESTVVERGQTIKFQCNEAMIPEMELEATCRFGNIQYPKCTAAKS